MTATDPDEGANGNVTYSMTVALPRPDFQLDAATGLITTLVQLDREVVAAYQLRLVATDRGTPALSSTTTLSLVGTATASCAPTCRVVVIVVVAAVRFVLFSCTSVKTAGHL